jgi:hypothetical protein
MWGGPANPPGEGLLNGRWLSIRLSDMSEEPTMRRLQSGFR